MLIALKFAALEKKGNLKSNKTVHNNCTHLLLNMTVLKFSEFLCKMLVFNNRIQPDYV